MLKKCFLVLALGLLFNLTSEAKILINLSDGTVLEFPDGTNNNVINTSSQEVIYEKNKRLKDLNILASKYGGRAINQNAEKVKIIAPWEKPTLPLIDQTPSIYRFTNGGNRESVSNANIPEGNKSKEPAKEQEKKAGLSSDEWLAQQKIKQKVVRGQDGGDFLSSIKSVFGPNNAVECAQKYFPKIKFQDAQHLIVMSCGIWFLESDLNSNIRSASKCIAKSTSDIYSSESGLKVISDCSKGNAAIYSYFEPLLMDNIVDKVNQQMREDVQREVDRVKKNEVDAPTGPIYIYDAATGINKYCFRSGPYLNCY